MLMVILWWKRVTFGDANFVAAHDASVDAGVRSRIAG